MRIQLLFIAAILLITSCAQSQKSQVSDSQTEMQKVETEDINKKISKEVEQKVQQTVSPPSAPQSILTCKAGSDVRILEILSEDQKSCQLQYTKNGDTKTVAKANFNLSYCETVQTRISQKLETAGFSCQ